MYGPHLWDLPRCKGDLTGAGSVVDTRGGGRRMRETGGAPHGGGVAEVGPFPQDLHLHHAGVLGELVVWRRQQHVRLCRTWGQTRKKGEVSARYTYGNMTWICCVCACLIFRLG